MLFKCRKIFQKTVGDGLSGPYINYRPESPVYNGIIKYHYIRQMDGLSDGLSEIKRRLIPGCL